jgi:hypothetical protein
VHERAATLMCVRERSILTMDQRAKVARPTSHGGGGVVEEQGVLATEARSTTAIVTCFCRRHTVLTAIFTCARIFRLVICAYHNPPLSRHAIDCQVESAKYVESEPEIYYSVDGAICHSLVLINVKNMEK